METAIKQHRARVLYDNCLDAHRITVRRGSIMEDTLRPGFDERKHVRVRFLGKLTMNVE